ncbi:hypothetical protein CBS101457_001999 [Exobasidium rhododendri]|nr:hypothetical protein CBS101457_001999 [Exobasidium rhododendri]
MVANEAGPSSLASAPSYAGPWTKLKPALHPLLQHHITSTLQFSQMTPVQSSVIPLFLSHRDVIVEAVTGSGKTLAYALPVLQMMLRKNEREEDRFRKGQVGALIVCPTRELAIQVYGVLNDFVKAQSPEETTLKEDQESEKSHLSLLSSALLAVGGSISSPSDDYKRLRELGSNIIVGTPGRVEELLKRPGVDVRELEVLILDEADRLLDLGFSQTLQTILQLLPKQRRTGLFSATMTDALGELARVGLRNPVRVVVKVESKSLKGMQQISEDRRMPASLQNQYLVCRAENKLIQLIRLLRREAYHSNQGVAVRKAIVYFSTCAQVNYFYKVLSKVKEMAGIKLYSLHGQQTPSRRTITYDAYVAATPMGAASSTEAVSVLFCTDVAARGLDLPNVDLVVQFDPPTDPKVFSHRCGRTARAGRLGRAVVFLNKGREEDYVDFLKIRKSPVRPYPYLISEEEAGLEPEEDLSKNQTDKGASQVTKSMRKIIKQDRELYELSVKAFVSFIKCYKKHEVNFVFREKDMDFAKIATCFALLRLPRMPEIDRWRKEHKEDSVKFDGEEFIDMDTFAYADKAREKQRLEVLEKRKAEKEEEAKSSDVPASKKKKMRGTLASETAWSLQKAKKERKEERKEKKAARRAYDRKQKEGGKEEEQPKAIEGEEEEDDWAEDERVAKKARKVKEGDEIFNDSHFDDL